jgi:hypothetical protein
MNPLDYGRARKEHALLLKREGFKLREIGDRLGVGRQQARMLAKLAEYDEADDKTLSDELSTQVRNSLRWVINTEITPESIKENAAKVFGQKEFYGRKTNVLGKLAKQELIDWCKKHGLDLDPQLTIPRDDKLNERRRLKAVQLLRRIHAETGDKTVFKAIALLALVDFTVT